MHYVTERWLGGTLTNFRTIRLRLKRLEELEAIEQNDNFASYSKKMESQLRREMKKIKRNLEGIRHMDKLPARSSSSMSARDRLREARKLGIPTICLIDTDGDPEWSTSPSPATTTRCAPSTSSIRELCLAIAEGKQQRQAGGEIGTEERPGRRFGRPAPQPPRPVPPR
jgi:small subunit ribosomal protein S2